MPLAAQRIARGKLMNAGQTCIAPDYALVREGAVDEFVRLYQEATARLYPRLIDNRDYTAIINQRHYDRLCGLVATREPRARASRPSIPRRSWRPARSARRTRARSPPSSSPASPTR